MTRALLRTTEARSLLLAYALTAIGCAFLPLADHLGFEFAAVLTLVAAVVAPLVGFAAMRLDRSRDPALRRPARAAAQAGLVAVGGLLVPTVLILLNGLRRPLCDPVVGAIWMLLLPAPTAWLAATLGALARLRFDRLRFDRLRWAIVTVAAVELLSVILTIATTYLGPTVFALDHFAGYFPGPLYDVSIPISAALLSFRLSTVAWGVAAVAAAGAMGSVDRAARRMHASWAIALSATLLVVSVGWGSALGWRTTDRALREALRGEIEVDRLVIHFPSDLGDRAIESLVRDAVFSAAQVERALGISPTQPVHIWMYRDARQKRRLVGAGGTQFAKPYRHEIHVQLAGFPHGSLRHELVHAMSAEFARGPWLTPGGLIPNGAMIEGFAVAYDLDDEALTPVQAARAMRDVKLAPDLERLLSPRGFFAESGSRAYTYAGAFIRYLDARFGTAAMRTMYRTGDLATLGDAKTLVADFERMLDTVQTDANARSTATRRHLQASIFRRRCAREVEALLDSAGTLALNREWTASLAMFDEACALQPDDPFLLRRKLHVAIRMKATDISAVRAVAEALWAHPQLDPGLEAESRTAVGDELWRRGETAAADSQYLRAAALPADPTTRRATTVSRAALADPSRAALLGPLLAEADAGTAQLLRMSDALATRPRDALVLYLLGRQFHLRGAADKGAELMERADTVGLGDVDLTRENLRSLVVARAERNRCDEADRARARLVAAGGSQSDLAVATDWVARCRFSVARGWQPL